jgi:hypothetical protein
VTSRDDESTRDRDAKRARADESDEESALAKAPLVPGTVFKIALAGLFFHAAGLFAGALLSAYGLLATVLQAFLADYGLGRLGVRLRALSDERPPLPFVAKGALVGFSLTLATTLVLLVTKSGHFEAGGVVVATLATGLLSAGALAMWHELFFRGLVLRLTERVPSLALRVAATGLASFAATLAVPEARPLEAVVEGLLGAFLGCLWLEHRGGMLAVSAHAGWFFASRALFRGGVFELAGSSSALGGYGAGPFAGAAAAVVLSVGLAVAAWRLTKASSGRPASSPPANAGLPTNSKKKADPPSSDENASSDAANESDSTDSDGNGAQDGGAR